MDAVFTYSLMRRRRHLFVEAGGGLHLVATGTRTSVGRAGVTLGPRSFAVPAAAPGVYECLAHAAGVQSRGLLGADLLAGFDVVFDAPRGVLHLSEEPLPLDGTSIPVTDAQGLPCVVMQVGDAACRTLFDTGAALTYLPADLTRGRVPAGEYEGFHPMVGRFMTETHLVDVRFGDAEVRVRAGTLPASLAAVLAHAGVDAIVGNEMLKERAVGYFPRRDALTVGHRQA